MHYTTARANIYVELNGISRRGTIMYTTISCFLLRPLKVIRVENKREGGTYLNFILEFACGCTLHSPLVASFLFPFSLSDCSFSLCFCERFFVHSLRKLWEKKVSRVTLRYMDVFARVVFFFSCIPCMSTREKEKLFSTPKYERYIDFV